MVCWRTLAAKLLDFSSLDVDDRGCSRGGLFHVRIVPSNVRDFADDDLAQLCISFNRNRDLLLREIYGRAVGQARTPRTQKEYDDLMNHVGLVWVRLAGAKGRDVMEDEPHIRFALPPARPCAALQCLPCTLL